MTERFSLSLFKVFSLFKDGFMKHRVKDMGFGISDNLVHLPGLRHLLICVRYYVSYVLLWVLLSLSLQWI